MELVKTLLDDNDRVLICGLLLSSIGREDGVETLPRRVELLRLLSGTDTRIIVERRVQE